MPCARRQGCLRRAEHRLGTLGERPHAGHIAVGKRRFVGSIGRQRLDLRLPCASDHAHVTHGRRVVAEEPAVLTRHRVAVGLDPAGHDPFAESPDGLYHACRGVQRADGEGDPASLARREPLDDDGHRRASALLGLRPVELRSVRPQRRPDHLDGLEDLDLPGNAHDRVVEPRERPLSGVLVRR